MDVWMKENSPEQRRSGIGCTPRPQPDEYDEKRAEIAREELMEIACPWIAIRKRKREAALIRREEEGTDSTQDDQSPPRD
jgi:hypothetical protein